MEHFRQIRHAARTDGSPPLMVVQLLGDIDDFVSEEDNKDLRASEPAEFYWLRVRGTGHGDIVDFSDTRAKGETFDLGAYRQEKFMTAAFGSVNQIRAQNEELPLPTDPQVTHLVFVLHGIRDLGEWSSEFEQVLRSRGAADDPSLKVISVRYGFFSMAEFLFRADREKYVRWFMDQYTEYLARYPNATQVDFIGHSNGTYLLASALEEYSRMKLRRIVFGGSVVRRDCDWKSRLEGSQVEMLRNYTGSRDGVVALFPRFFEPRITKWMGNNVGSAGFAGFTKLPGSDRTRFANVAIEGGHGAFRHEVPQIADFLLDPSTPANAPVSVQETPNGLQKVGAAILRFHWQPYAFWMVWVLLAVVLLFPGIQIARAAGAYALVPALLYIVLVVLLLRRV